MYDLNAKMHYLNHELDSIRERIENNDIDGCTIITFKKDHEAEIKTFFGNVSYFEWLGILDHAKRVVEDWYDAEEEQE